MYYLGIGFYTCAVLRLTAGSVLKSHSCGALGMVHGARNQTQVTLVLFTIFIMQCAVIK